MKNLVIVLLTFAVVGMGGYIYSIKQSPPTPVPANGPEIAAAPAEAPAAKPAPTPEPEPEVAADAFVDPDSFSNPGESKEQAAIEQVKRANDLIAALHEENQSLKEETQPDIYKGIRQIVESPEIKQMVRQGMGGDIKQRNAGLFRWMELDEETETAVTELMIEQGIEGIGTGLKWMTGNVDESREQMIAARENMYTEMEKLVGPEKMEIYKYWEDSKNERESVQRFNNRLGENKLDETTSDELVGMMYDTRADFTDLDHLSKPENFDPREMDETRRTDIMGQVEQMHGRYVENAATILTPEQLPQYEANLERQRQRLDGMMKFTHGMFNRRAQAAGTAPE